MQNNRNKLTALQRLTYATFLFGCFMLLLVFGKPVLMPLGFAAFLSFLLLPLARWFESFIKSKIAAVSLTFIVFLIVVFALTFALGAQILELFQDLPSIGENLKEGFLEAFHWVNERLNFTQDSAEVWFAESIESFTQDFTSFLGSGLSASAGVVVNLTLILIYAFLLLLYRSAFKQFFLIQFNRKHRKEALSYLQRVSGVSQGYIYGLLLVMLIIAVLYSVGLMIIGVKYAIFWGILGGALVFIPYIGSFLGGFLPFLYALVTTDTVWQPLALVILVVTVQTIEGNIITPRVVGKAVGINPLFSILSIIIGGTTWGIPGIILAIPFIAILKSHSLIQTVSSPSEYYLEPRFFMERRPWRVCMMRISIGFWRRSEREAGNRKKVARFLFVLVVLRDTCGGVRGEFLELGN